MKKIIYLLILLPVIGFCQENYIDYNKIISEIKLLEEDDDNDKKDKKNKVHRLQVGLNGGINIANLRDIEFSDGVSFENANKFGNLYGGTLIYNFNRFTLQVKVLKYLIFL